MTSYLMKGDTVRLSSRVKRGDIPEGREDNFYAKVSGYLDDVEGGIIVDRDLNGMRYWNEADLVRVKKAKILAYTDYPIIGLGDVYGKKAPMRGCEVLEYDGDKYATVKVGGVIEGVKTGYIYRGYTDRRTLPAKMWEGLDKGRGKR